MEPVKILIADNQYLTRKGIIDFFANFTIENIFFEVSNKEDLFDVLSKERPRLLLIDYDSFDLNAIDDLSVVKTNSPDTTIIIVSNNTEPQNIEKILELGINNYVLKTAEHDEFESAIHAALNNKKYFSEEVLNVLILKKNKNKIFQPPSSHITHAETEIIRLIAQGLTTKEIAAKKFLSFHTIITHRKNIFKKLGINNTSELVSFAFKSGIVDATEYYI
jgi:DNA-binding NarL/FixJ family response regulator